MSTYMDQADKAVDKSESDRRIGRKKQTMHYCEQSPFKLSRDSTVSDNLNGNLRLSERDFAAADIEPEDTIRVLVEREDGDGQTVEFTERVYSDGRGFNLPIKYRRQLDLEHGDTVRFWIERVNDGETSDDIDGSATGDTPEQHTLSGEPIMDEPYALIEDGDLIYHHLEEGGDKTRCGIELDDDVNYQTFSDPGDVPLEECSDCMIRDSENMTNEDLARWIAGEIGFELGSGPPSYFNKSQLVMIRDYILEMNEVREGPETDPADEVDED